MTSKKSIEHQIQEFKFQNSFRKATDMCLNCMHNIKGVCGANKIKFVVDNFSLCNKFT